MIFFCNIPFVFFAGKVALLAVVYECFYDNKETDQSEPRTVAFGDLQADNSDGSVNEAPKINRVRTFSSQFSAQFENS